MYYFDYLSSVGLKQGITNKEYKKLYLCNENARHSISFNRNSDKLLQLLEVKYRYNDKVSEV